VWNQLPFKHVTIVPGADSLGHLLHGRFPKWFQPEIERNDRQRLRGERHIIVGFAGQLAEAKFRGKHPRYGIESDNSSAVDMAFHLCNGSAKIAEAYLRYCWCVAESDVAMRWREIQAVAAALLERKTLSYEDVIEVVFPGSVALRAALKAAMARKRVAGKSSILKDAGRVAR
jgi:hypothetical protein